MRKGRWWKAAAALCCGAGAVAAAGHVFKIEAVGADAGSGDLYLDVQSSADVDGDGAPDEGFLRLTCTGGQLASASFRPATPRGASEAGASGRSAGQPPIPVEQWVPAAPKDGLPKITPKIAKESHGRVAAGSNGWEPIELADAGELCPAVRDAARKATKTRSNIQNN